jgi:hypothetical protein
MKKLRRTSFSKQTYYGIEYFVGFENSEDGHWEPLLDVFDNPYRFEDPDSAMDKALEICKKGRWGQPITVRVINYEVTTETTEIAEFHSENYYNK